MKFLGELFKKFKRMDEEAANAIKDPNADRQDMISQCKAAIQELKAAIADSMANVNKMKREQSEHRDDVKKYNKLAESAMEQGNENDAASFLEKVVEAENRVKELGNTIKAEESAVKVNRNKMDSYSKKVADAESNIVRLHSREKSAQTRKRLLELSQSDAFSALDDMKDDICEEEDKVRALEELAVDPDQALEDKYSAADADEDISGRLAKLREKVAS